MRAEIIAVETEDFGHTGLHKSSRVMRLGHDPDDGEPVVMRLSDPIPTLLYLNETVTWIAGNISWSMSVEEYNAITEATDRLIGIGRKNKDIYEAAKDGDG